MISLRLFYAVLFIVLSPLLASAHGDRPSLESYVGDYLVDIGYDTIGMRPDEEVTFDFDLYTESGAIAFAPFEDIHVQILKDEETMLDELLVNDSANIPTLSYTFPEAGDYRMQVAYRQADGNTIEETFPLTVEDDSGALARFMNKLHYVLAAFLVIATIVLVIKSRR